MDTVQNVCDGLALSMGQMLDLIGALMESARKKEALIVADDVQGLESLLAEETETAAAFRQKEKELRYRADALRRALGVKQDCALREICGAVEDAAWRERLTAAGDEINGALELLSLQNEKLRELLRQRIGYADYMLNLLHSPASRLSSYNMQGGKEDGPSGFSLLDCRA